MNQSLNQSVNQSLTIDLDYADPPGPPDLLERARRGGQGLRRSRRAGAAIAAFAVLGATVGVVQTIDGWPAKVAASTIAAANGSTGPKGPSRALDRLPASIGHGPAGSRFVAPGYTFAGTGRSVSYPPAGRVEVLYRDASGTQQVMWISKTGALCLGERATAAEPPQMLVCEPLLQLPAEGLWGPSLFSPDGNFNDVGPVRWIVAGLVRGPVTAVRIGLPGGSVKAHLAATPDPELGTLYWVTSDAFNGRGAVVDAKAAKTFGKDDQSISRTVYRGGVPMFHCAGSTCVSPS